MKWELGTDGDQKLEIDTVRPLEMRSVGDKARELESI